MSELQNTPVVSVEKLTRCYGKNNTKYQAVRGVDFHVYSGEVYGLLGTNGAGKTSTLEVVEGLAPATSGTVRVFGKDPYINRAEVCPHMGIMLQSGGLPAQLTVGETIKMWAGTCSQPQDPNSVLSDVELSHRKEIKVGVLSGGEQRRLDLACALLGNPSLLFLDEPTTGLDPESRHNVWNLLLKLKERGVTMILTTHYLIEAETLCDRIGIMNVGKIACEGTLPQLTNTVSAEISFKTQQQPPEIPGTTLLSKLNHHTIFTNYLQKDTHKILQWASKNRIELQDFSAYPASLEKVFLHIAGTGSPD